MAHENFGNLADVFKHVALAEILGSLRAGEYWESHAGAAINADPLPSRPDRLHGIHTFARLAAESEALRTSLFYRVMNLASVAESPVSDQAATKNVPGSPLLARLLMGETSRRLLFCDTDAQCLNSIRTPLHPPSPSSPTSPGLGSRTAAREIPLDKIECVQDDGVTVLRGAGILLPEPWTNSTVAFIDPDEFDAPTDADISPLQLACELAARGIVTLLWYGFTDDMHRLSRHQRLKDALEKSRLQGRNAQRFEGALKTPATPKPPTQWGWGMLTLNAPTDALGRVTVKLRALEAAYEKIDLPGCSTGAWKFMQSAM